MTPRTAWHPWAMLAPTVGLLTVFFIIPVLLAAYESFFSWDLLTPPRLVGGANYVALAAHGRLLAIALRTMAFSLLVVAGTMTLGLALALLLARPGPVFGFVRASLFSAYVVSWVAVALVWMAMLDGNSGVIGRFLRELGPTSLTSGGLNPLGDRRWALPTLAVVAVWKLTGYAVILFLAGFQSVPSELYEAAALDGAGRWSRFRHVTLPILSPTTAFVATTTLVTSFQAFDIVRIITQGGPARATELFVVAIYEQIFLDLSVGRASALSIVFFALLVVLSAVQLFAWRGRGVPS